MSVTVVYLPFKTNVNVHGFANADFQQRLTLTPESGQPTVWTGAGEGDSPLGQTVISTPASGQSPLGFEVQVNAESNQGGTWVSSAIAQAPCSVWYYNLVLVVSEDYLDNDWNDAVAMFTWWVPPSERTVPASGSA